MMKRLTNNILTGIAIPMLLLSGCEMLEPEVANVYTLEDVRMS